MIVDRLSRKQAQKWKLAGLQESAYRNERTKKLHRCRNEKMEPMQKRFAEIICRSEDEMSQNDKLLYQNDTYLVQ